MDVRRSTEADEPGIFALARRTLGWDDDPRFEQLFRWKHDENAYGASPRWVAVEDGRVVGFRVFLRWRFERPDGTCAEAVRAVDTATDPDHQGRGIFTKLTLGALDELRDEGVACVFNTPNGRSRPGYLKMGWEELGRPPVAVAPRPSSVSTILRSRTGADLWTAPTAAGRPAAEALEDPEVMRALTGGSRAEGVWRTDRDEHVVRWRYGSTLLGYRVLTAADIGDAQVGDGVAVFRVRRRGPAQEATVACVRSGDARTRRRLLRAVLRRTRADYAVVAGPPSVDLTPAVSHAAFSPLVTWRALAEPGVPDLAQVRFDVGDLELF